MKRVFIYMMGASVAIIFVVSFFVTIKPKKVEMENKKSELLQQQLEEIELKVIDLTNPRDLNRVEAFNSLVEAHRDTVDICLVCQFLGDESRSDILKEILFYSLNEAPFDSYLKVFECVVNLYIKTKNKMHEYFLWTMLLPAWDDFGNFSLVKNYRDERFRKIIIENKKKFPVEMAGDIELILSGFLWDTKQKDRELDR